MIGLAAVGGPGGQVTVGAKGLSRRQPGATAKRSPTAEAASDNAHYLDDLDRMFELERENERLQQLVRALRLDKYMLEQLLKSRA